MPSVVDQLVRPVARKLHKDHMQRLGIAPTMRLSHAYNRFRHGANDRRRRELYREQFEALCGENGGTRAGHIKMEDGYAIDTSGSLPHLDRVMAEADAILAERAGIRKSRTGAYRSYFQNVWKDEDAEKYPAFLDFCTSSEVLSVVAEYLGCIPVLSTTLPPGIRLMESNAEYDDQPTNPRDSQLFHMDYYSLPNVYVNVLLNDVTLEHGPWTFLPRSVSERVKGKVDYWSSRKPYRLKDEEVYSVIEPSEVIPMTYPRGTVLFIESSGCMHYGSRGARLPRFTLMYSFTGACRTDFSEVVMKQQKHPVRETDSRLRKMVLDKSYLP